MPGVVDQAWHCPEQAQRWSACLVDCCFWFFHRVLTLPPSDGQFTVHYLPTEPTTTGPSSSLAASTGRQQAQAAAARS